MNVRLKWAAAPALAAALGIAALSPTPAPGASAAETLATGEMARFQFRDAPADVPGFEFRTPDEAALDIAKFKGKVVLLNFWATWCAPCVKEMPALQKLQADLGSPDFAVVAVNEDRGGLVVAKRFADAHDLKLDLYLDPPNQAARALKLRGLPTTLLVDRDGREIGRFEGGADWSAPEAEALIRHYVAAK